MNIFDIENNILRRHNGEAVDITLAPRLYLKEISIDAFSLDRSYIIRLSYFTKAYTTVFPDSEDLNTTFFSFMAFLTKLEKSDRTRFAVSVETVGEFSYQLINNKSLENELQLLDDYDDFAEGLPRVWWLESKDCHTVDAGLLQELFPNLRSVSIDGDVIVDWRTFAGLNHLQRVDVKGYESIDGVLFTEGRSQLVYYPVAKEDVKYTLHESTKICNGAFKNVRFLETLVCIKDVELEEACIENCYELERLLLLGENNKLAYGSILQDDITVAASPELDEIDAFCDYHRLHFKDIRSFRDYYIRELKLHIFDDLLHFNTPEEAYDFLLNHPVFKGKIDDCLKIRFDTADHAGSLPSLIMEVWIDNVHEARLDVHSPFNFLEHGIIELGEKVLRKYGEY